MAVARGLLQLLLDAKVVRVTALLLPAVGGARGKTSIAPAAISTRS
jgi:hypothetical protein